MAPGQVEVVVGLGEYPDVRVGFCQGVATEAVLLRAVRVGRAVSPFFTSI
jgi:hypothetical protein